MVDRTLISNRYYYYSFLPLSLSLLLKFFNSLFTTASYPQAWSKEIIHQLLKKGDANNPDNYKRMSVCLSVCVNLSLSVSLSLPVCLSVFNNASLPRWQPKQKALGQYQSKL